MDIEVGAGRVDELLELHRLVGSLRAATTQVLAWLAERAGCRVALFDRSGRVVRTSAADGPEAMPAPPARELFAAGAQTTVRTPDTVWVLVPFEHDDLVLTGFGPLPLPPRVARFLHEASWLVAIAVGREEHDAQRTRLVESEFGLREGVVTLVLSGQIAAAHRVAGLLGDRLPEPARVFVIDADPRIRDRIANACARDRTREVWVARCSLIERHVLVIAAAPEADAACAELAALDPRIAVGASTPLPLRHAAFGYDRVHTAALPQARLEPERWSILRPERGLAHALGEPGRAWARSFLAPLLEREPARAQDPTRDELVVTLRTWLTHGGEAPRRLYVHRNTLAARLRLVGDLLGADLNTLTGQATVSLALDLDALPHPVRPARSACGPVPAPRTGPCSDETCSEETCMEEGLPGQAGHHPRGPHGVRRHHHEVLAALLDAPASRDWAAGILRGIDIAPTTIPGATLRTWLAADAHASTAAARLGISVQALRKRLARMSPALGGDVGADRVLRQDLWLAMRVTEGARGSVGDVSRAHQLPRAP